MANHRKHFMIFGLGSFGSALARRFSENGCRVTGIDRDSSLVEALKGELYEAAIGDVTERSTVEQLGPADADAVFIGLGEQLASSLLATLYAKEAGAKRIIVKGVSEDHAKLLRSLGVERVVFPETEIARTLADQMTWPNVLDYVPIDPDYSVVEIAVPDSLAGSSLLESDLRRRYNIWVIGIKDALTGKFHMFPDPEFRFTEDQLLIVVGKQKELNTLRELK
jgi:trk system potassium uptake protein TrkA